MTPATLTDQPVAVPDALAELAWDTLAHPDAISLPYACRRLIEQAALAAPLIADAQRTVARIALDVLAGNAVQPRRRHKGALK